MVSKVIVDVVHGLHSIQGCPNKNQCKCSPDEVICIHMDERDFMPSMWEEDSFPSHVMHVIMVL